jgi:hypothetical protein
MVPSGWLFWAWWLPLILALVEAEEQAEGCSATRCGNLTISDPFWLVDSEKGRSCGSGSTDFEVVCYNNTPVLRSPGLSGFEIIDITYEERIVHAIDLDKLSLLHASDICDILPRWNTSAKLGHPFRISNTNLNLILYNCTEMVRPDERVLVETKMGCGNQHKVFVRVGGRYNETSDYGGYAIEGCDAWVLPVMGTNGSAKAGDYKRLISDGFLLTWYPPPRKFLLGFSVLEQREQSFCSPLNRRDKGLSLAIVPNLGGCSPQLADGRRVRKLQVAFCLV